MAHYRRKVNIVLSTYGEIVRNEHEKKVNDTILAIREKGNTIVSVIPDKLGMKPIMVKYDLVYDENRPSDKEHCRFLKSIVFALNEVQPKEFGGEGIAEAKINETIDKLCDSGAKIINIISHNIGISPVMVMYDIIYEAEKIIEWK